MMTAKQMKAMSSVKPRPLRRPTRKRRFRTTKRIVLLSRRRNMMKSSRHPRGLRLREKQNMTALFADSRPTISAWSTGSRPQSIHCPFKFMDDIKYTYQGCCKSIFKIRDTRPRKPRDFSYTRSIPDIHIYRYHIKESGISPIFFFKICGASRSGQKVTEHRDTVLL